MKQTELDDIVDNMKKFQELAQQAQQSMINEIFSRSVNPAKVKNKVPFNND